MIVIAEKRKRKIDDECQQFQEQSLKYFIKTGEKALCVICNETRGCDGRMQLLRSYRTNIRRNMQSWRFLERFSDLDSKTGEVKLLHNPFGADVASCPDKLQLEVIELLAYILSSFGTNAKTDWGFFYQFLLKEDSPNIKTFASSILDGMYEDRSLRFNDFLKIVKTKEIGRKLDNLDDEEINAAEKSILRQGQK
ncbi:hypothetical protein TNCV_4793431 [Trichonephila clavipes]|nr:hypothetical protein TNCV_4793431 [Trichonephila clavipes]